jgi:hypothetical protein
MGWNSPIHLTYMRGPLRALRKYRLRLTADDGSLMSSSELEVVIQAQLSGWEYEPVIALTDR